MITLPLDRLLATPLTPPLLKTARVLMALLAAGLFWASVAALDEVAVASGEVVPQEQVQTIQHLEGGIIEKILVSEGDRVAKGAPLLRLSSTSPLSQREELTIQQQALTLKQARLEAEAADAPMLDLATRFPTFRPELVAGEQEVFSSNRDQFRNELSQLQEQFSQRELDKQQLLTEKSSIAANLALLREKYRISSDLIKDQLTSRMEHLQLASEMKELEGRMRVIDVAIPRAGMALEEAAQKREGLRLQFRNAAQKELGATRQALARIEEALHKASDQVARTEITSPVAGIVKALKTHTIGGVIQPGEAMMEIVPESRNLVIEAKLHPNDVGFVRKGQPVLVKLHTYDYTRFGGLEGKVEAVSADSLFDPATHAPYFKVRIRTDKTWLGSAEGQFPITPGMQVTADIKTGSKSVMAYLLKPFHTLHQEAFRER